MLVLNQLRGAYAVAPKFMEYKNRINELLRNFDEVEFVYISGERNPAHKLVEKEFESGTVMFKFERGDLNEIQSNKFESSSNFR